MARPTLALNQSQWTEVRTGSGAIAADSGTLTDANIPPASGLNCFGYDSIYVAVEIVAGASPTMTIEALFRDADAADGARWKRLMLGAKDGVTLAALANETTGALAPDVNPVELRVFGWESVFLRVTAVANPGSTTSWKILAMPGKTRNVRNISR